jgi:hypothetical protein
MVENAGAVANIFHTHFVRIEVQDGRAVVNPPGLLVNRFDTIQWICLEKDFVAYFENRSATDRPVWSANQRVASPPATATGEVSDSPYGYVVEVITPGQPPIVIRDNPHVIITAARIAG